MHNDRNFSHSVMIMDSKPDPEQNAAPLQKPEGETERRRKRIRHAWTEAPHAHDAAMRWVAWLLMLVLIIVAFVAVHRMLTGGK